MKLSAGEHFYMRPYYRFYNGHPIILSEFHRHIFEFFKKEGFKWCFKEDYADFLESLWEEEEDETVTYNQFGMVVSNG